ncbi:MAG: hypothetical protein QM638_10085 [Nocardioides sp.]|uniref:hypothetical protein n=1 Tax=Nocardioides sp. TaxID=35761 RepID=UPI0039E65539
MRSPDSRYLHAMFAADAAEERGNVAAALRAIASVPDDWRGRRLWRPARIERLLQLEEFGPLLPRWATSRWLLAQAHHHRGRDQRGRLGRAVATARAVRRAPGVHHAHLDEDQILDHDWVCWQTHLYDYGGLDRFLRYGASPELVAAADRVRQWGHAPMRALQLVELEPKLLHWRDPSEERVRTINLGAAVLVDKGEWVLGRVVPIGDDPTPCEAMFESAPLLVPEPVARAVADDPPRWVEILERGCAQVVDDPDRHIRTELFDFSLLSDIPWVLPGLLVEKYGGATALIEHLGLDGLACVAALLVRPGMSVALGRQSLDSQELRATMHLAELLPEPAASILRHAHRSQREEVS